MNKTHDKYVVAIVAIVLTLWLGRAAEAGGLVYVTPYFEVGAGYAFDTPYGQSMDDEYYSWKGSNPVFIGSVGFEVRTNPKTTGHWDLGYTHISNFRTGFPFNSQGETGLDMLHIKYRWRF